MPRAEECPSSKKVQDVTSHKNSESSESEEIFPYGKRPRSAKLQEIKARIVAQNREKVERAKMQNHKDKMTELHNLRMEMYEEMLKLRRARRKRRKSNQYPVTPPDHSKRLLFDVILSVVEYNGSETTSSLGGSCWGPPNMSEIEGVFNF